MPFDVEGARAAGYGDKEIADFLARDSGFDVAGARRAGYTDAELISHLRPPASSFAQQPTDRQRQLSSAPVRVAKGLKDPVDGAAQLVRRLADTTSAANPFAGAIKAVTGKSPGDWIDAAANAIGGDGTFLGDVAGIKGASPQQLTDDVRRADAEYEAARKATAPINPQTGERDPGFDGMRLVGNVLSPVSLATGPVLPAVRAGASVATNAGRAAAGGAAGAALQPVSSNDFATTKAGQVAGGAAGGALLGPVVAKVGDVAGRLFERYRAQGTMNVSPEGVRDQLVASLRADGIDAETLPEGLMRRLADDVRGALASGKNLDVAAALRKQDFDALGVPATRGQLTRNPMQWQEEFNLSGVHGIGEPLQGLFARQTRAVDARLEQMARGAGEAFDDGGRLVDLAKSAQAVRDGNVRAAYGAFRESTGRDLEVPLQGLAQDYAETVRRFGDAIPSAVRRQFEGLGLVSGTQRKGLSIEGAEDLIRIINANADPANKPSFRALGELRQAVQRAITGGADTDAEGAMAAQLAREARGFAADNFRFLEQTPGLRAAVEGMEPDQFVQKYVIGGKVNELQRLGDALGPEGRQIMAAQMAKHLQQRAFGANVAGDGSANAGAFNRELMRIGRPKLVALFGDEGADQLQLLGRVLAYSKQAPDGAVPNRSGTGAFHAGLMSKARTLTALPWLNEMLVKPLAAAPQRLSVQKALSPVPQQATELDPKTVEALSALFAPVPLSLGLAIGQ